MADIYALEKQLSELPAQIRDARTAYIEAKDKTETAKLKLNLASSQAMIEAQAPNATEKKAKATLNTEMPHKEYLKAVLEMERAENEWEYLKDRFTAVRKIASLEQEMLKSQLGGN